MKKTAPPFVLAALALTLAACGTASGPAPTPGDPAPAGPNQVIVTLADNTINATQTTFKVGVAYTFVIKNNGNHLHNFNIAPPVSVTGSEDASLGAALLAVTQDKLPIGGGTSVQFTFPASAAGKALEFSCLIRRHYEDGMRLAITVTN